MEGNNVLASWTQNLNGGSTTEGSLVYQELLGGVEAILDILTVLELEECTI